MSLKETVWAMAASDLTPAAKLVLILLSDWADMDGAWFGPVTDLATAANLTIDQLDNAISELTSRGFASYSRATDRETGENRRCVQIYSGVA